MIPEDFEAIWQAISIENRQERGWHVRKLVGTKKHELQVGRSMPSGRVGLLYAVRSAEVPADVNWPDGKGFRTDVEVIKPGPNGKIRISLQVIGSQYRDVFAVLCSDVCQVVADQETEKSGILAFVKRLHAWQKFMQVSSPKGMAIEQVKGLFAELSVLETVLLPEIGPNQSLRQWQGRGGLHDFVFETRALEVKSSTSQGELVFRASQLDQFDETLLENLQLCFVAMREDTENGEGLTDLISRLRKKLSGEIEARQRLDELLLAGGYHDAHATLYVEPQLRLKNMRFYEVRNAFPRFRISEVPEGILSGKYTVSLSDCADYEVDRETAVNSFLRGDHVND